MISPDQEKAFDRQNWQYLNKAMRKMNFEEGSRKWVRLLYTDVNCIVIGHILQTDKTH